MELLHGRPRPRRADWDVLESVGRLPWATIAVCVLVPPTWVALSPDVRALARLAVCLCSVAVVLWPMRDRVRAGSRLEGNVPAPTHLSERHRVAA